MSKSSQSPVIIEDIIMIDIPGGRLGYEIKMSDRSKNITLTIQNSQNCCERYGMVNTSGTGMFIGAKYIRVDILCVTDYEDKMDDCGKQITINIHTDKGIMDITFYNDHNGYYSHDVSIETENGSYFESL